MYGASRVLPGLELGRKTMVEGFMGRDARSVGGDLSGSQTRDQGHPSRVSRATRTLRALGVSLG